jgi:hypothetical protein
MMKGFFGGVGAAFAKKPPHLPQGVEKYKLCKTRFSVKVASENADPIQKRKRKALKGKVFHNPQVHFPLLIHCFPLKSKRGNPRGERVCGFSTVSTSPTTITTKKIISIHTIFSAVAGRKKEYLT